LQNVNNSGWVARAKARAGGCCFFMLPAGIIDGLFACSPLILILMGYLGKKGIKEA